MEGLVDDDRHRHRTHPLGVVGELGGDLGSVALADQVDRVDLPRAAHEVDQLAQRPDLGQVIHLEAVLRHVALADADVVERVGEEAALRGHHRSVVARHRNAPEVAVELGTGEEDRRPRRLAQHGPLGEVLGDEESLARADRNPVAEAVHLVGGRDLGGGRRREEGEGEKQAEKRREAQFRNFLCSHKILLLVWLALHVVRKIVRVSLDRLPQ